MSELKKCPFCGGEACMNEHVFTGYSSTFGVVCLDCCAETRQFYDTKEEAVAAWNRRTDHIRDTTKKVSNADRIRGMSDEELAEWSFYVRKTGVTDTGNQLTSMLTGSNSQQRRSHEIHRR